MDKCKQGLEYLLNKYDISDRKYTLCKNSIVLEDGKEVVLLPWRSERRFTELKNLITNGTMGDISVIRICNINHENSNLNSLIYRELDLCEIFGGSEIISIFAVMNANTANIIAKLKNDVICTVEVATTLSKSADLIDKHEIITTRGICCDRVVDTQVPQKSIYVFKNNNVPETYLDTDFELYGLDPNEVTNVRCAFEILKNEKYADELMKRDSVLNKLVEITLKSAKTSKNILVEDEK